MALPKSFSDLIESSEKPVLVDFWAEWCGPCKMVSPIVERVAKEFTGKLITVKVNIDKKQHLAQRFDVTAIPTIMLFWKGASILRIVGARSYEDIVREIRSKWPAGAPPLS